MRSGTEFWKAVWAGLQTGWRVNASRKRRNATHIPDRATPLACQILELEARILPAIIMVTTTADVINAGDGVTSLREAIMQANGSPANDEVHLGAGTYTLSITGPEEDLSATGDLDLFNNGSLRIVGAGAILTTITASSLNDRVIDIQANSAVTLSGIQISGGSGVSYGGGLRVGMSVSLDIVNSNISNNIGQWGGGIYADSRVNITSSTIANNEATNLGGGMYGNYGSFYVLNSLVTNNSARNEGGGAHTGVGVTAFINSEVTHNRTGFGSGGAVNSAGGTLQIENSLFANNTAVGAGGAISTYPHATVSVLRSSFEYNSAFGAGALSISGDITISESSISNNTAVYGGGGLELLSSFEGTSTMTITGSLIADNVATGSQSGGGGMGVVGDVAIINSTISGNTAGLVGGGIKVHNGNVTLLNSTISNNRTQTLHYTAGSGIRQDAGTLTLHNTIIAGNYRGSDSVPNDIGYNPGTINYSSSYNLISDAISSGGIFNGTLGNIVGVSGAGSIPASVILGPLSENGGSTRTHALVAGSPAINSGMPGFNTQTLPTDQRGSGFSRVHLSRIDIGAYELQPTRPVILTGDSILVPENNSIAIDVNAVDYDLPANHLAYSIVGGVDASRFVIHPTSGILTFATAPNYELPLDSDQDNVYSVQIQVSDGTFQVLQNLDIQVADINEPPSQLDLSNLTISEGQPVGTLVGVLSGFDQDAGDTLSFSLVAGTGSVGNSTFVVDGQHLRLAKSLDYEAQALYQIRVRVTDFAGMWSEQEFVVNIANENESPANTSLSISAIAENSLPGALVGQFVGVDPDTDAILAYELVGGSGDINNDLFYIDGDQLFALVSFDYESKEQYHIRVRTRDQFDLFIEQEFLIAVTDINEPPTDFYLSYLTIDENLPAGTHVGTITATDPDFDTEFTYSLVGGEGADHNAFFTLAGSNLVSDAVFDYEESSSYSVRIRVTDRNGLFIERSFAVAVGNIQEPPSEIFLSHAALYENMPIATTVGVLSSLDSDSDSMFAYSLVTGTGSTNNAAFKIVGDQLQSAITMNYESKSSYTIRIRSTDQTARFVERVFEISILNVNETPTGIQLSNFAITENLHLGSTVAELSASDPDVGNVFTFSLVDGTGATHNSSFTVVDNQLKTALDIDYESLPVLQIRLRATDQEGLYFELPLQIYVFNLNEAPVDVTLTNASVTENLPAGTLIGSFDATDPDISNTFTYALVSGAGATDNSAFSIINSQLIATTAFDFESKSNYSIRVQVSDQNGAAFSKAISIQVQDVNEIPVLSSPTSTTSFSKKSAKNGPPQIIPNLVVTDPDLGAEFRLGGGTLTLSIQLQGKLHKKKGFLPYDSIGGLNGASSLGNVTTSTINSNQVLTLNVTLNSETTAQQVQKISCVV